MDKQQELIDVWVTKNALTAGIKQHRARVCANVNEEMIDVDREGNVENGYCCGNTYFHKNEWFRTKEEALAKAESMRSAKIKNLEKLIDKLKKLKFE